MPKHTLAALFKKKKKKTKDKGASKGFPAFLGKSADKKKSDGMSPSKKGGKRIGLFGR